MNKVLGCMNTRGKIPYQSLCQIYCTAKHENIPKTKLRVGGKTQPVVTQLSSIWYRRLLAPSYV